MKMKKRLVMVVAMVMAASMTLAGCGGSGSTDAAGGGAATEAPASTVEQVLRWNIMGEPKTIDPQLNAATDGSHIINNTFEGLMREKNGEIVPGVAESYTMSEDGLVYTFTLRDSKWSDGQPVTAKDFEYAWKRAVDPMTASEYGFIVDTAGVKNAAKIYAGEMPVDELGIKAIDEKTLEVTLERPTEFFLRLTGFPTLMPVREDVVDKDGVWAKDPSKVVCNGPFKLVEYKMGDQLVLAKNPEYWNADSVKLEKIVGKMIVDESTFFTQYNTGELDIIEQPPSEEIPRLIAEDPTFYSMPYIGTYYYAFNMNAEVFQDAKVRKALNLALDRKKLVEQVTRGGQQPATGFVPPAIPDAEGKEFHEVAGDFGVNPEGAEIEEAKKLLAEAGYPDGKGFPEIELLYNTSEGHKLIAEALQEMWKQNLNINVKLTNQEWAVFQETTKNNAFVHLARRGWIGDYLDPMTMLDIFEANSPQNIGRYNSAAYDGELKAARETLGTERMDHLYKAQEILMDDMPMIPLYYYVNNVMVKDNVQGWELSAIGKFWFGDIEIVEVEE